MPTLSISRKLTLSVSILVLVAICALTAILLNSQSRLIRAHSYDYSTLITEQLASNAVEPLFTDDSYQLQALVTKIASSERILGAGIFDLDGQLIAHHGQLPTFAQLQFNKPYQELALVIPVPSNTSPQQKTLSQNIAVHIEPVRFKGATAGYAVASYTQAILERSLKRSLAWVAGVTAALFLAICTTTWLISRHMTRPIKQLITASEQIREGKFQAITTRHHDEFDLLIDAVNDMGADLSEKSQLEQMVGQMLTKGVAKEVFEQMSNIHEGGEQIQGSVLFADIVGFTNISESLSPREVSNMLNEYFNHLEACAKAYFGTIDKFIGDCVMIVFGSPKKDPQHEFHALACAVLMQKLMSRLNERRLADGQFVVELRIGVNSGPMLAGLLGSSNRMEYTVVGDSVNLASRLCNEAESSQIIIEESLYKRVSKHNVIDTDDKREIRIRGKSSPVSIYNVSDIEQRNPFLMENLIQDLLSRRKVA